MTGANAIMPIQSGALAGLANLRDTVATQYQSQLNSIAGGLINAFAETSATAPTLPGLFTYCRRDLGSRLDPGPRPRQRDHGLIRRRSGAGRQSDPHPRRRRSMAPPMCRTPAGAAGYNTLINNDLTALTATQTFPSGTGLASSNSVTGQAAESASWLDGQYQSATNSATYQTTLSAQASQALSNATGVNIDQQMSQMLDLENSYQASAKLISTINSMFNSLLQAVA